MQTDTTALQNGVSALLGGFQAVGLDADALARQVGLGDLGSHRDTKEGDGELLQESVGALWAAGMQASGDPLLPLWVGAGVPFGAYEIIDYLCSARCTLRTGLRELGRYLKLVTPHIHLGVDKGALTFRATHAKSAHRLIFGLYTLGITVQRFRGATGVRFVPLRAEIAAPLGQSTAAIEEWLGVECSFGHPLSRLVFEEQTLELPLKGHQPGLASVLERHAADLVRRRRLDDPLRTVRAAIRQGLERSEASLPETAKRLGMGERTLQRRLSAAAMSFQQLLDDERQHWASELLADPRLSVNEVAFLLGYSEQSAFARAFKRWTGQAPSAFRRRQASH